MKERGSALLTSVIAIMVLLMVSGVMFTFVNYRFKVETSEEKGLRAYYMAEAGINYGVAKVRSDPEEYFKDSRYLTKQDLAAKQDPFGTEDKGEFEVSLEIHPAEENYIFTVTSIGYYPDKQGIKRVLEEQYTYPKPVQAQP
ncbi:hypothetical protein [Desulfitobacterium sp.]|uniref:hypothetical protein n=1 Tax=Desulfitobacterium sp. TaxID=49981 RepID=UPI002B1EB2BC|nr:hypothetical protein [Desulfitobacterium sp.]MEA4900447.1 hypothetical protein [Desulfitobacterium sp.]